MVRFGMRTSRDSELENFETPDLLRSQCPLPLKPSILSLLEDDAVASALPSNVVSTQELTHSPPGHWAKNWGQVTTKLSGGPLQGRGSWCWRRCRAHQAYWQGPGVYAWQMEGTALGGSSIKLNE